jgi:1,4-dihydroxy-2-naphthoyl-CoA hydrolase
MHIVDMPGKCCICSTDCYESVIPSKKEHFMAARTIHSKIEGSIEFSVIERTDDRVVSEMPIHAGIKNPFGIVQAGAILWLADVTASVLVLGDAPMSEGMKGFPLAINLNANLVGNQTDGTFTAVATFVKRGRTVSIVRTVVYGAHEKLIADITTNHLLSK